MLAQIGDIPQIFLRKDEILITLLLFGVSPDRVDIFDRPGARGWERVPREDRFILDVNRVDVFALWKMARAKGEEFYAFLKISSFDEGDLEECRGQLLDYARYLEVTRAAKDCEQLSCAAPLAQLFF